MSAKKKSKFRNPFVKAKPTAATEVVDKDAPEQQHDEDAVPEPKTPESTLGLQLLEMLHDREDNQSMPVQYCITHLLTIINELDNLPALPPPPPEEDPEPEVEATTHSRHHTREGD